VLKIYPPAPKKIDKRLHDLLSTVMVADAIPEWLETPNDGFGGLTPQQAIDRSESWRIERMIEQIDSGMLS
jgi:Protein of unknown function (DUF2384)